MDWVVIELIVGFVSSRASLWTVSLSSGLSLLPSVFLQ